MLRELVHGPVVGVASLLLALASCVTPEPAEPQEPEVLREAADPEGQDEPPSPRRKEAWHPPEPDEQGFDWIMLKSGEWLKGALKYLRDDDLEFESDELDTLAFDLDDVHVIRLARREDVVLEGRRVVSGTVAMDRETVRIRTEHGVRIFPRADVISIVPTSRSRRDYWSGDLSVGVSSQSGNTEQTSSNAQIRLRRRSAFSRVSFDYIGNMGTTESVTNVNNHRADTRWDLFLSRRWFITPAQLTWFRDPFQNISTQLVPSAGFGYHVFPGTDADWTLSLNAGTQYTEFDSVAPGDPSSETLFTLIPATDLDWEVTKDLDWRFSMSFQVPLPDTEDRIAHLATTLSLDLWKDLDLDLTFQVDRVANPSQREDGTTPESNDFRLSVGVGWEF